MTNALSQLLSVGLIASGAAVIHSGPHLNPGNSQNNPWIWPRQEGDRNRFSFSQLVSDMSPSTINELCMARADVPVELP